MQGIEQEVCQLFFAVFRQKKVIASGKTTTFAALLQSVTTKDITFVPVVRL
jgi:hypothetical protein